jgi:Restriction endonuclease
MAASTWCSTAALRKFSSSVKQWRAMKVGVSTIRELYGVMAAKGVASGIVVTPGRFTDEAVEFASGRNVKLAIDRAHDDQLWGQGEGSSVIALMRDTGSTK